VRNELELDCVSHKMADSCGCGSTRDGWPQVRLVGKIFWSKKCLAQILYILVRESQRLTSIMFEGAVLAVDCREGHVEITQIDTRKNGNALPVWFEPPRNRSLHILGHLGQRGGGHQVFIGKQIVLTNLFIRDSENF